MTEVEMHIYDRVKNKTPRKRVGLEEGLHEATVLDIFKRQAKRAVRQVDGGRIRILGVDEISLRKGTSSTLWWFLTWSGVE